MGTQHMAGSGRPHAGNAAHFWHTDSSHLLIHLNAHPRAVQRRCALELHCDKLQSNWFGARDSGAGDHLQERCKAEPYHHRQGGRQGTKAAASGARLPICHRIVIGKEQAFKRAGIKWDSSLVCGCMHRAPRGVEKTSSQEQGTGAANGWTGRKNRRQRHRAQPA